MEHDRVGKDDKLGEMTTGEPWFNISGSESELGGIKPYLLVKHSCSNKQETQCVSVTKVPVSDEYVSEDENSKAAKNLEVDLSKYETISTDCSEEAVKEWQTKIEEQKPKNTTTPKGKKTIGATPNKKQQSTVQPVPVKKQADGTTSTVNPKL